MPEERWFPSRFPSIRPPTSGSAHLVPYAGASTPTRSGLSRVGGRGLRGVAEREQQLLKELEDAERRAANRVLDKPTLTAALGSETARVLHSAHEVAAEMVAKAEAESERLMTEAHQEIEQHGAREASRWWSGRPRPRRPWPSCVIGPTSRWPRGGRRPGREAEELLDQAREQCRAMVDEAQGLRPGSCPTWPSGARYSTPRSSSSGPVGDAWPRRSTTSGARST